MCHQTDGLNYDKISYTCSLCGTCCCFVHYFNWKFETLFFCWGWIVLKFWAKM